MEDKRIYKKPEIEEYGTLKTITQGQKEGNNEQGGKDGAGS